MRYSQWFHTTFLTQWRRIKSPNSEIQMGQECLLGHHEPPEELQCSLSNISPSAGLKSGYGEDPSRRFTSYSHSSNLSVTRHRRHDCIYILLSFIRVSLICALSHTLTLEHAGINLPFKPTVSNCPSLYPRLARLNMLTYQIIVMSNQDTTVFMLFTLPTSGV